ncbi:MAG TPA: TAXI family TRAP transporter solute-binding subunit [Firmicutes bacterium]|nr:TAXI family TRAP transporter solute-binding subunit [Bacillota bacterium]
MRGKIKTRLAVLLAVITLLTLLVGCGPNEDADVNDDEVKMPELITIGASEPGSSWYPMAVAMKDVLEKEYEDMQVEIFYGGGDINLKAIEEGKIDFGITFGVTAYDSLEGRNRFDEPLENVRGALGIFLANLQMVTRPDSDIKSVADLKGKTISTGMPGYATTGMFPDVLKVHGVDADDVTFEFATMPDVAVMFKDKSIDLFAVHSTIENPFPIIQDITANTPIRLLSISEEDLEELNKINPGHLKVTIPGGLYRGQDEDVVSQGNVAMLATRADLPDEVVYNVIKTLIENSDELANIVSDLKYINAENGPVGLAIPLHPGAEQYYEEQGTLK